MHGPAVRQPFRIGGLSIMFILTLALLLTAACGEQGSAKDEKGGVTKTLRTPWSTAYMAIGAGSLWLANDGEPYGITRVDLAKSEVVAQIEVSGDPRSCDLCSPQAVDASGRQVWFTDRATKSVSRIDPETDRIVESIPVGFRVYDIAIDGDTLWLTGVEENLVARVDTDKKQIVGRIDDIYGPTGVVVGGGSVWVMGHRAGDLVRIDPQTSKIVEKIPLGISSTPEGLGFGEGGVWTTDLASWSVSHFDPKTSEGVAEIDAGMEMFAVDAGDGSVWATGQPSGCEKGKKGILVRIDPTTDKVVGRTKIPCAYGVAVTDDAVWVNGNVKKEGKWAGGLVRVEPPPR